MKKRFVLGVLVLVVFAVTAVGEEVVATILFEPQKNTYGNPMYSLSTRENSRVADKTTEISYGTVGNAIYTLPNYLVKGAKIVYENEGLTNEVGEWISPRRFIAIILEDGYYMELTEIISMYDIAGYFWSLYAKLKREGRA